MNAVVALIWLHVVGNVFWVGAICGVAVLLASSLGDARARGALAERLYLWVAVPGFVLSFGAGMFRVLLDPWYLQMPWMHAKLALAFVIIGVHHVLGARARRLARAEATTSVSPGVRGAAPLGVTIALCAAAAVFFAITKLPAPSTP
ncbi:MAG: hypothetical protein AAGN82_13420 [Myxococcota bacterium]